jgi:hypothetical protein
MQQSTVASVVPTEQEKAEPIGFNVTVTCNEDGSGCGSIRLIENEIESVESLMEKLSEQVKLSEKLQEELREAEEKMAEIDRIKTTVVKVILPNKNVDEFDEFAFIKQRKKEDAKIKERQEKINLYRYCGYSHKMAIQITDQQPKAPVTKPKKVSTGAFAEMHRNKVLII